MTERAVPSTAQAGVGRSAALAPAPAFRVVFLDQTDGARMRAIAAGLRRHGYTYLAALVGRLPHEPDNARHHEAYLSLQRLPDEVAAELPLAPGNRRS
jgi:hypothetical protein